MAAKSSKSSKKTAASATKKATAAKRPAAKKPAPKAKPVAKKATKPAPAKKAPVAKPAAKKPAPAKKAAPATKATPTKKAAPAKKTSSAAKSAPSIHSKPTIRTGPSVPARGLDRAVVLGRTPLKPGKIKPLTAKDLEFYKDQLLKLRDRVIDEISFLANDNLNRSAKDSSGDLSSYSFHMADQGTDNFDREFAASLLNSEHDVLYEIEEALRRIEQGTYGVCEMSGNPIERERLKVLPFARYSVSVQSEIERGKPRFRPFRRTSIQSAEPAT